MSDSDPNRPRDFGDRLKNQIHDEINARMQAKLDRRRERMERRMDRERNRSPFGGLLVGTILAGIGVLLLLDNLGFTVVEDVWRWWPAILIAVGAARVLSAWGWGGRIWGAVLMMIGGIFLLDNLNLIHANMWNIFWPVILIAVGLGMLARGLERGGSPFVWMPPRAMSSAGSSTGSTSADVLSEWGFFGGVRRRVDTQKFEGGEVLAIFSGVNIDLTKAGMQQEEAHIEANALFGGIDIRVPENWQVVVRGAGIFGGYEDKTWRAATPTDEKRPRLVISGFAVFGGVVVKT